MSELIGWQVVNAATIQRGDRVDLNGCHLTVADMYALPRNRKHLIFEEGGTYCLAEVETLYAYRAPQ